MKKQDSSFKRRELAPRIRRILRMRGLAAKNGRNGAGKLDNPGRMIYSRMIDIGGRNRRSAFLLKNDSAVHDSARTLNPFLRLFAAIILKRFCRKMAQKSQKWKDRLYQERKMEPRIRRILRMRGLVANKWTNRSGETGEFRQNDLQQND